MKPFKKFGVIILAVLLAAGCGKVAKKASSISVESPGGSQSKLSRASEQPIYSNGNSISYGYKTEGKLLSIYNGDKFKPTYLNGVNIGSGVPGFFPGEHSITKKQYSTWLEEIGAMNCNCVRVYTTQNPDFYEAIYDYNEYHENKIYLFLGVWYDEDTVLEKNDAFEVLDYAVNEAKEQVDIIHGDATIEPRTGRASGRYTKDISKYVIGWILGIESDAEFIGGTNKAHPDITSYDGQYLSVSNSDAFHAFLCHFGDEAIKYETEKYKMQRPVSWSNWPTADMLEHPQELSKGEDAVVMNVENIKPKETFEPGVFASYHIYPYYPDFMMRDEKYHSYTDETGKVNTYEAYLKELISHHNIPVLVAEFGVPTSRGCTHVNAYTGFNQGHLTEAEQAAMLESMAQDIYDAGYCGGIVFSWQDEWFKRTWNTADHSNPNRRAYWSDDQTSEQFFGVMAFDPGGAIDFMKIDGKMDDWNKYDLLLTQDNKKVYVKKDCRNLYICVEGVSENDKFFLPFDVTPESGSNEYKGTALGANVDFIVDIDGRENTRVLVHKYYDKYAFGFGPYDDLFDETGYNDPNSKDFVPIYLCLNRTRKDPATGASVDSEKTETGLLKYGTNDPTSPEFNNLVDFCYGDNFVELKIPWAMLNFRDPSDREIEGDFWKNNALTGIQISTLGVGINDSEIKTYKLESWDKPEYHERLKQAYYTLQRLFEKLHFE
ncbi:MAG: family 2 glycosyl transferase [Lachnospiraceae bacterium]|nr:family 2 glycosyl transferase [Lachnospiraceae bacterium]